MTSVDDSGIPPIIARGVEATVRGDYATALPILAAVYKAVPPDKFPQGLSAYGLCLSQIEHKNKIGAELCEKAIKLQGYDGQHWANLVRLYMGVKNRKRAVEILEKGLKRLPNDTPLTKVRKEIGWRKNPYLRFIRRQHPLNKAYSVGAGWAKDHSKMILLVAGGAICIVAIIFVFLMVVR